MLGFGRHMQMAAAQTRFEVLDREALIRMLEGEECALLYGDMAEQERLVDGLIRGSDKLVALVGCEKLQEGHRQIAVRGRLGRADYENIVGLGFLPDLIVARCTTIDEAAALTEWMELGPKLICMVEPKTSEHIRWGRLDQFGFQLFCGAGGTFVLGRVTSSQQLPS